MTTCALWHPCTYTAHGPNNNMDTDTADYYQSQNKKHLLLLQGPEFGSQMSLGGSHCL